MNFFHLFGFQFLKFTNLKNKMYQFIFFFQPIILLTIIKYMLIIRPKQNVTMFLVAVAVVSMWNYVLYSCGSALISETRTNTLRLLVGTKTSLFKILLSKIINNAILGALSLVITFLYAIFIFYFAVEIENIFRFVLSVLSLIISLSAIGMILAIIFNFSENVYSYQNVIVYPFLLLSGLFTHLEDLPLIGKIVSIMLPTTWSIKSISNSFSNDVQGIEFCLGTALLLSLIYTLISYILINRMESNMKKKGEIGGLL
ncbi:ABC transporter permease [Brevibacillus sp. SAFN-007a]|uniref:ABC transporter permease n=1 Tax=Brevibacillus sp. SAFN-007a TaxID=3436862 RepID=UPI003F7FA86E